VSLIIPSAIIALLTLLCSPRKNINTHSLFFF
jgi:hypothetical protein